MKRIILLFVIFLPALLNAESICDRLSKEEKERVERLADQIKLYDCCDESVNSCLKKEKVCRLATRIKEEICLLIREKLKDEDIKNELSNRAKSMTAQIKKPEILFDPAFMIGDKDAKVTVVAYICARCPFCAIIIPKLISEIKEKRLKGKAKLYIRPFPLKSHEYSLEGGLAMVASAKMGRFGDFLLKMQEDFMHFSLPRLNIYAGEAGLDIKKFEEVSKDPETKKYLETSKKEGLRNGVNATPTFFINGKKYYSNYHIDLLTDAILEEYDRVTGEIYEK